MREYLRPDEIAKMLKISKRKVYDLINDVNDPLPSVKIDRVFRINLTEFEEWLQRREFNVFE